MRSRRRFLLFLLITLAGPSVHAAGFVRKTCDLECANGGYCSLRKGTAEELTKQAQQGKLIEECVCPPGFTGIACENTVSECSLPDRVCHNGLPCEKDT